MMLRLEPGTLLDARYRVDRLTGRGALGVVVRAKDLRRGDEVAVKLFDPGTLDGLAPADATAVMMRFQREAQLAARVRGAQLTRVVDVGKIEGRLPYAVYEVAAGSRDLASFVQQVGPLSVARTVAITRQVCDALGEIERGGYVHNDIKPANVFMVPDDEGRPIVQLLAAGLARAPDHVPPAVPRTILGTPHYMAPEQLETSRAPDRGTHVWALGTLLYALVEGHPPFAARRLADVCAQIVVATPAPPSNLPPPLAEIALRCLAKDPADRFSSVDELADALRLHETS